MNRWKIQLVIVTMLVTTVQGFAQQSAVTPASLLSSSAVAMQGQNSLADITLSGTARWLVGTEEETGMVQLQAISSGSCRLDFHAPSGTKSEVQTISNSGRAGSWIGTDRISHTTASHNLMTGSSWFYPVFMFSGILSDNSQIVQFVDNDGATIHIVAHKLIDSNSATEADRLMEHLSRIDIYLNAATLLPEKLEFNSHADTNALMDIPVTIQYSNYLTENGITFPSRIQRSFNSGLQIDMRIQPTSTNSGLTNTSLNAQ